MKSRFKELRIKTGLTQAEFREKFNARFGRTYTAAAISQIETGKRIPEISTLIDFADFYEVSIDYLIGRDDYRVGVVLTDEQNEFLKEIAELDEDSRGECLEYISFLKQKQEKKPQAVKSSISQIISHRPRKVSNYG